MTLESGKPSRPSKMDPFETTPQDAAENPNATKFDAAASPRSRRNQDGQRIGSFRIVHPIANGSMGQVFRAVNEGTGETVALKLIRAFNGQPTRENDRNLFLREMAVLNRLNHPRIIRIRDFGSAGGQLFLAMEFVETIDLRRELTLCEKPQQIRMVCGIGCYILEGLCYAHSQNIVHRDIKPANILVYRNPQRDNKIGIKLADFGISKDVRQAGLSGMTREGEMRGTPAFMSPEQLQNARDVGPASDIYSTAAVLYYLLTGVVPHQTDPQTPITLSPDCRRQAITACQSARGSSTSTLRCD